MGRTDGKNGNFVAIRMKIHQIVFFFHDSLDLKKRKEELEAMPKFLIVMCICHIFATVTVLQGSHLVP